MNNRPVRSNLRQRVLSGIVLVALALALALAGGVWFRLLAVAIAGAVLYEWTAMATPPGKNGHRLLLAVFGAIVLAMLLWGLPVATLLAALAVAVVAGAAHAAHAGAGPWPVTGLAYAGLLGIALAALRGADAAGLHATLLLFIVVWATDILAYFVGRAVGGPKLAPSISPGKTWSGAAGGTAAAVVAGLATGIFLGSQLGWAALAALVLALSVVSQTGDLFESSIKRRFGVKDSGNLIPGHGGVMDRVDGLAAAAVVLFALGAVLAGPDMPAHAVFAN